MTTDPIGLLRQPWALMAAEALCAVIVLALGAPRGWSAGAPGDEPGPIEASVRLVHPVLIGGEPIAFELTARNTSKRPVKMASFARGHGARMVKAYLVDENGDTVPRLYLTETGRPDPEDWVVLGPGQSQSWERAKSGRLPLGVPKPGRYELRVEFAVEGRVVKLAAAVNVVAVDDKRVRKRVRVPVVFPAWLRQNDDELERTNPDRAWPRPATAAALAEQWLVEALDLDGASWLCYRRVAEHGRVVACRIGELRQPEEFLVSPVGEFVEVAWLDPKGQMRLVKLDAMDGTSVEMEAREIPKNGPLPEPATTQVDGGLENRSPQMGR